MPTILIALCILAAEKPQWEPLFDGKSLDGWKVVEFGGDGDVKVDDGRIVLKMGNSLTGITHKSEELPKSNYEIELEAMRVEGERFLLRADFSRCRVALLVYRRRLGRGGRRPFQYRRQGRFGE